jgi:TrpR-related protein YerC/YecD
MVMPQISRNPVHKDVYYSIRDDFIWILSALRSQEETKAFFYDFFTKTERIMFAKRLAVAMMIYKGFQYEDIRFILHVSTATISRVADWLDRSGEGVRKVLDKLITEEHTQAFWDKINHTLDRFSRLRK